MSLPAVYSSPNMWPRSLPSSTATGGAWVLLDQMFATARDRDAASKEGVHRNRGAAAVAAASTGGFTWSDEGRSRRIADRGWRRTAKMSKNGRPRRDGATGEYDDPTHSFIRRLCQESSSSRRL